MSHPKRPTRNPGRFVANGHDCWYYDEHDALYLYIDTQKKGSPTMVRLTPGLLRSLASLYPGREVRREPD